MYVISQVCDLLAMAHYARMTSFLVLILLSVLVSSSSSTDSTDSFYAGAHSKTCSLFPASSDIKCPPFAEPFFPQCHVFDKESKAIPCSYMSDDYRSKISKYLSQSGPNAKKPTLATISRRIAKFITENIESSSLESPLSYPNSLHDFELLLDSHRLVRFGGYTSWDSKVFNVVKAYLEGTYSSSSSVTNSASDHKTLFQSLSKHNDAIEKVVLDSLIQLISSTIECYDAIFEKSKKPVSSIFPPFSKIKTKNNKKSTDGNQKLLNKFLNCDVSTFIRFSQFVDWVIVWVDLNAEELLSRFGNLNTREQVDTDNGGKDSPKPKLTNIRQFLVNLTSSTTSDPVISSKPLIFRSIIHSTLISAVLSYLSTTSTASHSGSVIPTVISYPSHFLSTLESFSDSEIEMASLYASYHAFESTRKVGVQLGKLKKENEMMYSIMKGGADWIVRPVVEKMLGRDGDEKKDKGIKVDREEL
ncbi:hypothetical protein BKA69DRAFT_1083833 [Paraphysoderma sedebokerense]|nr:hypothetical protein BKA69DRAFT_1083833 [Paraphysoderma sedebokerense]